MLMNPSHLPKEKMTIWKGGDAATRRTLNETVDSTKKCCSFVSASNWFMIVDHMRCSSVSGRSETLAWNMNERLLCVAKPPVEKTEVKCRLVTQSGH